MVKPWLCRAHYGRIGTIGGVGAIALCIAATAWGHGVAGDDANFLGQNQGFAFAPYLYLGAKHMVTGVDHLLFLFGVVFFLYRLRDVALYVTLFAIGHSVTMLLGVLADLQINAYLIDAVIGLSVVYKAFENLGGFARLGLEPNLRIAVTVFGFCHGLGLASKLQDLALADEGLVPNMLAFNLGVEIGQLLALVAIVTLLNLSRRSHRWQHYAIRANWLLLVAGFALIGYQLVGFDMSRTALPS